MDKNKDLFTEWLRPLVPFLTLFTEHIPSWLFVPIVSFNVCSALVWNFMDLIIMMVSTGLFVLFEQFNIELEQTKVEVLMKSNNRFKQNDFLEHLSILAEFHS